MLYNFCAQPNCADGAEPPGGLVLGTDGNFYGITGFGGTYDNADCGNYPYGCGTVFKITPGGKLTTLYNWCSQTNCADGYYINFDQSQLIQATDGNFYGTNNAGGAYGNGTIYTLSPSGTLTTLYNWCSQTNCTDGTFPVAPLIQATDGNFYGTTVGGGAYGGGTVFKITRKGELTTLYSFCAQTNCTDGSGPFGGLVQGTDGNFYGVAGGGGAYGYGTVFRVTPNGRLTTLHSFDLTDGNDPTGGLVLGTDGNFYGTTFFAGGGFGTIFGITPGGTLTTLYTFCLQTGCPDGNSPAAPLAQATNGIFYGTTYSGGANSDGTVFSLAVGLAARGENRL